MIEFEEIIHKQMSRQNFDALAFALLDFKNQSFETINFHQNDFSRHEQIFDLASLTKPLSLANLYLAKPDLFDSKMQLLLEHKGGLPAWGRLSLNSWKQVLLEFDIKESPVEYSDLSFLRLMLEVEKASKKEFLTLIKPLLDKGVKYWFELTPEEKDNCVVTGWRNGFAIKGAVHDDNAYTLKVACSHAGLFSSISSLSQMLLKLDLKQMAGHLKAKKTRFVKGWDTPSATDSLAGDGYSDQTFGHLGFTGTSFWIDCKKALGVVILTNATQNYWYERNNLNELRRELATLAWQQ